MSISRWAMFFAATLLLLSAPFSGPSHTAVRCDAPPEITRLRMILPNTARRIDRGKALVIVAIGSSSTQGVGASDPAHTYPAQLAEELRRHWPKLTVNVINKGAGGEIASEMLARFDRDVLPYQPQLVIWQTGSNHALRSASIEGYADTIREGISRLRAAGIDVILMDPQFAPRLLARPMHLRIVESIRAVAKEMKVAVFPRFALMRHWVSSHEYKMEDVILTDGLHMNDLSYGCIAHLLADSLVAAVEPRTHVNGESQGTSDAN